MKNQPFKTREEYERSFLGALHRRFSTIEKCPHKNAVEHKATKDIPWDGFYCPTCHVTSSMSLEALSYFRKQQPAPEGRSEATAPQGQAQEVARS